MTLPRYTGTRYRAPDEGRWLAYSVRPDLWPPGSRVGVDNWTWLAWAWFGEWSDVDTFHASRYLAPGAAESAILGGLVERVQVPGITWERVP